LTVKSHLHPYGKPALKDVLEGKADVATVAETPFMFAVLDGADISVIATIQSSTRNNAVIVRKDSGVSAPGDLKGKRIAVILGTTAEYFMDAFIARHGIARSEVDIVNLKPEEYQAALNNGRVDAIAIFEPYLSRAQDALGGSGMTFYDEEIYTETFNIVARKDFIRKNPGMVRKVLRALIRAEDYVRSDPSGAGNIIADYCGIDRRKAHQVLTNSHFGLTLDQSLILALEDESRWAIRAGLTRVSAVPNYLEYINPDGLAAVKPERVSILR
jgi:NitT/TauT family transport system substrate-binding protein